MHRSFTTPRYFTSALLVAAAASSFVACIPFDTEEEYFPPMNGATDVVSAAKPPPPISGGTLVVSGKTAVATDPDRDRVSIINLTTKKVTATVALKDGDEPGRVVVDAAGRAHVALRAGGAVATIDLESGKLVDRSAVCAAPRGIAFDAAHGDLVVACVGRLAPEKNLDVAVRAFDAIRRQFTTLVQDQQAKSETGTDRATNELAPAGDAEGGGEAEH